MNLRPDLQRFVLLAQRSGSRWGGIEHGLCRIEAETRLLERASSPALVQLRDRAWQRPSVLAELAGLTYSRSAEPELLSRALDFAEQELEGSRARPSLHDLHQEDGNDWAKRALQGRVAELRRELELSQLLGSPELLVRVRANYAQVESLDAATQLARDWLVEKVVPAVEPKVSLFDFIRRKAASLPGIRVIERPLLSRAAAGEGVLYVRPATHVLESEAERIWLHEVEGHLSMRRLSRTLGPPFGAGSNGAWMDEEGRAVWLEEAAGYLTSERRRELALAHIASLRILSGAAPLDVFDELRDDGGDDSLLINSICRAARGGGLCRELGYLTGYLRVTRARAEVPLIVDYLGLGRLSVPVALELARSLVEEDNPTRSPRVQSGGTFTSPNENL